MTSSWDCVTNGTILKPSKSKLCRSEVVHQGFVLSHGHVCKDLAIRPIVTTEKEKIWNVGIKLILCDKQKGLEAACQNIYPIVRFARCSNHLLDNQNAKQWELEFWRMVKAPTADAYTEAFVKAEKINPESDEMD